MKSASSAATMMLMMMLMLLMITTPVNGQEDDLFEAARDEMRAEWWSSEFGPQSFTPEQRYHFERVEQ